MNVAPNLTGALFNVSLKFGRMGPQPSCDAAWPRFRVRRSQQEEVVDQGGGFGRSFPPLAGHFRPTFCKENEIPPLPWTAGPRP